LSPSPRLLRRMILVDVTWSEWQPDRDRPRYEKIVEKLVEPLTRNSAELEPVYIHQCHEEDQDDTSWAASATSYELPHAELADPG
jgi:hypothetical protein